MTITSERIDDSSAAEEIGGNEDLVTEILLRLPVKSLLRFELVSKKWLSLISYPHFAHNYAHLHNPNYEPSGLLLTHECSPLQFIPFNGDNDHARVRHSFPSYPGMLILQSCNGLLLCSSPTFSYCKSEYYIYNPTTKQSTTIRFPSPEFKGAVVAVNLAFDPLKSPHYKLLSIRTMNKKTLAYQIDIYSSETGSWRPPISGEPLIFTAPSGISMVEPVYCRGAIHWYTELDISLYFNTDTECLKTMPMPPFNEGLNFNNVQYFGEYRGHLHLIVIKKPLATEFDIWELETDYSGWFVRYRVNLDAVIIAFHPEVTRICDDDTVAFSVLCVARAEKEEESTLVLSVPGKAISFNLHQKTSKKLCDLMPILKLASLALDYDYFCAYQYIETLFHV